VTAGEARLESRAAGLTPVTDGWFVVDIRKAVWVTNETFGAARGVRAVPGVEGRPARQLGRTALGHDLARIAGSLGRPRPQPA
jgi:hypothetical protein